MVDLDNNVHLEILEACSIEETDDVLCASSEVSWMDLILNYVKSEVLSTVHLTTRKVKCQVPHYVLINEKLYKRSYSFPLLKYVLLNHHKCNLLQYQSKQTVIYELFP